MHHACAIGYCMDQPPCPGACRQALLGPSLRPRQVGVPGHIYLLHFDRKVHHAQHYLGWAIRGKLFARLAQHEAGNGASSPLVRALLDAGGHFVLARVWEGDRFLERRLKNRRNARHLCPVCRERHG